MRFGLCTFSYFVHSVRLFDTNSGTCEWTWKGGTRRDYGRRVSTLSGWFSRSSSAGIMDVDRDSKVICLPVEHFVYSDSDSPWILGRYF
jgi:hypothetical protein